MGYEGSYSVSIKKGKVKVYFQQAMNVQRGSRGTVLLFL
jgi:hypothetical protein